MTLSPLSAEELAQIRERAEQATQGPWTWVGDAPPQTDDDDEAGTAGMCPHLTRYTDHGPDLVGTKEGESNYPPRVLEAWGYDASGLSLNLADANFIAAARSDIPRLLETVAYWQEEAEKLKKALKPFATIGARLSEGNQAVVVDSASYQGSPLLTVGDFRKASLALSERAQGET